MTAKQKDYQALNGELEEVLLKLQQPDVGIDRAIELYERGLKLIEQMETYLEQAENKIQQLRLAASAGEE